MLIPTEIGSHLRVDGNILGGDLAMQIVDELTIPNRARRKAEQRGQWGWWEMPEDQILADLDGDTLVMPRGYAMEYKLLLREYGHKVWWIDKRTWQQGERFGVEQFSYRDHQVPAVAAMRKHQFGIYEAPTGSGKTGACCALLWELAPKYAMILVDKKELLYQWKKEIVKRTGCDPEDVGQIGDGKWNPRRFTVATVQTLHRKKKDGTLPKSFFKRPSVVIVDECHHVSADTLQEVVAEFWAKYLLGASATPDREDDKFEIILNILGDIVHAESEEELRKAGVIVKPKVIRVTTGFQFQYWGNHQSDNYGNCEKPGCKIRKKHGHKDNYSDLKAALVTDPARNALVASAVMSQVDKPHIHLIATDEVRHVEHLEHWLVNGAETAGVRLPPVYTHTGRMPKKKREEVIEEVLGTRDAILISTLAKEGLDIPRIDRIYLPFPAKQGAKVEQWVGRGTRSAEGKGEALIFDFADLLIEPLKKQFKNRRVRCYDRLGLEVVL